MPAGIPAMRVISTEGSSPLVPTLFVCGVAYLDKNLQMEKILELRSSRIDPFEENDLARVDGDLRRQTMAGHPVEAAIPGSSPLSEWLSSASIRGAPRIEIAVNALRRCESEPSTPGACSVEVVSMNDGYIDCVGHRCGQRRLASVAATVEGDDNRPRDCHCPATDESRS